MRRFAKTVLDLLASMTRADRQTLCFSATLPAKLETMLARVTRVDALVRVDCVGTASAADESGGAGDADDAAAAAEDIAAATPSASSAAPVAQSFAVLPSSGAALRAVHAVVSRELAANPTGAKVVVFFSTARMTQFAAAALPFGAGVDVFEIHSKKKQAARDLAADAFRAATTNAVLVTSDVSARGVDYPDVSLVVQCEAPTSTQQCVGAPPVVVGLSLFTPPASVRCSRHLPLCAVVVVVFCFFFFFFFFSSSSFFLSSS